MRTLAVAALLLATSTPALADIYLLSRHKLEGTDYTVIAALSHPQMSTLDACDAERKAARTTGFKLFARLYFTTHKGFSVQDQFYCVESDQKLTGFQPQAFTEYTYQVNINNNMLLLKPQPSFGACMAISGDGNQSSQKRFCAKSSQGIR